MDKYVEILLNSPDDFLKIKETLTRIGVSATYSKTLYQTCHILHKQGKYYIMHFKELLELDGLLKTSIFEKDILQRNFIVYFLNKINLCKTVGKIDLVDVNPELKIIKAIDKKDWILESKYTVGE